MDEWILEYQRKGALWIHDDNPKRPHALLTSGKHSNGFFNSRLVIPDENLLHAAASDLLKLFEEQGGDSTKIQGVVGPQTGATRLAQLLSNEVNQTTGNYCFSASPAKAGEGAEKSMVFSDEERKIIHSEYVLLCEDVLTTGGSVDLAVEAVERAGGVAMPYVLVLVNRSGLTEVGGRQIIALIDRAMPMWEPDDCPLCKNGSEAVRPKENWAKLNANY